MSAPNSTGLESDGRADAAAAHQPANAASVAVREVTLQLSGHTHGSMIRGFGSAGRAATSGLSLAFTVLGMLLYVRDGTALWSGFARRLDRNPR